LKDLPDLKGFSIDKRIKWEPKNDVTVNFLFLLIAKAFVWEKIERKLEMKREFENRASDKIKISSLKKFVSHLMIIGKMKI